MAITLSSPGGSVYDGASTYLNALEKQRAMKHEYDIQLKRLNVEAGKVLAEYQARMSSNNLQAGMANQRTALSKDLAKQQDRQEMTMAEMRAAAESELSAQRNQHESNLINQRGDVESSLFAQQQAAQARRDEIQQMYGQQNAAYRAGLDSAAMEQQFGYSTQRDEQQSKAQQERDALQFGYSTQRDQQQSRDQMLRDKTQFGYSTQRDAQQQQYTQQNMYQRETADVSARWQEQIQKARNNGLDFSEKQQAEMKQLDETFRKNVLNGPFDEGLKQQAMLEHQKKLAAIVPNQKIQNPIDGLKQNVIQDDRTGVWFSVGRDSNGYPTYEPLGGGSGGGGKAPDPEKLAEQKRKMTLEREHNLQKLDEKLRNEIDPETDTRKFKTQEEIDKEKMRIFAADELFYTDSGLPPHEMYQLHARREEAKQQAEQKKQQERAGRSQYDLPPDRGQQMPPRQPMPTPAQSQQPPAPVKQGPVSATNLDSKLATAQYEGDQDTATALEAVKLITAKYNGAPPVGTQEFNDLIEAYRILRSKGVSIETPKKKRESNAFEDAQGGWMQ
jgi:hypothetical protein